MASKSATAERLQNACDGAEPDSKGTKATLLKRLEEHAKKNADASASANEEPSAETDFECDAVLIAARSSSPTPPRSPPAP